MSERPIIISTGLIPKILDGSKAQTRRVIKHPEKYEHIRECDFCCPYGQVGDRLWVRETFLIASDTNEVLYRANDNLKRHEGVWKPSIHMPRWASRITLEITGIRVERLQEITEEDAIAEGITPLQTESWRNPASMVTQATAREEYQRLWDSLNVKYPWESNPWVWVIEWPSYKEDHE